MAEQTTVRKELRAVTDLIEIRKKTCTDLEIEYRGSLASLNRERSECAVPAEKEIKELNDRIWEMRNRINSLGFFKKKEKRELENTIAIEMEALKDAEKAREQQKDELTQTVNEKISVLKKNYEEKMKALVEETSVLQTRLEELAAYKPRDFSSIYAEWAVEDKEREREKQFILDEIKKDAVPRMTISEMRFLPGIKARNMTVSDISAYVNELVEDGRMREVKKGSSLAFSVV